MTKDQAMYSALAYAWGREDVSGVSTVATKGIGSHDYADAFVQMWDDMNNQRRSHAMPLRDTYDRWQATKGETIERD